LIAQEPLADRAASRLLCYQRTARSIAHRKFSDLVEIMHPGDLLVFNDARVIPAKFVLRKSTGGRVEGLFLQESAPGHWRVLLKNIGHAPPGMELRFEEDLEIAVTIKENFGGGEYGLSLAPALESATLGAGDVLDRIGRMPLPPYIKREKAGDPRDQLDRDRYQTVYAKSSGAVAAPTAGLHFSPQILDQLEKKGIEQATVTLQVGMGTFKPIQSDQLEAHPMHREIYSIDSAAAEQLNRAKKDSRRIIAVGTTSARVLESQPANEPFTAKNDSTEIYIYPPYQWKHVGALITNFHLPRSTLIALVAAMTGLQEQRRIYREAISQRYRFFSYGDAMLIE
jgi:S-adenosylmethionine:tRNA ribosyltransferase-isomerase